MESQSQLATQKSDKKLCSRDYDLGIRSQKFQSKTQTSQSRKDKHERKPKRNLKKNNNNN